MPIIMVSHAAVRPEIPFLFQCMVGRPPYNIPPNTTWELGSVMDDMWNAVVDRGVET